MRRPPRKNLTPKAELPPKHDLEPFQKSVNEAAGRVRGLWLGYIALLAYLFIAVGAVTHRDLLLQNPVKLPVLNVELPLIGFFAVAPAFLLINHFYLLIQLMGLGRRIRWFNEEMASAGLDKDTERRERSKLATFVIVQMLGGISEEREQRSGFLLRAIAFITLVIAPVALLLFFQLQFLPYQSEMITWIHRGSIGIDLGLLWVFWPSIGIGDWAPLRGTLWRWGAISTISFFSCIVATFPSEFADGGIKAGEWTKAEDSYISSLKVPLFGESVGRDAVKGLLPFSRSLFLPDNTMLIDLDKFDKIRDRHKKYDDGLNAWETGRTLNSRERNLRGAYFARSDLRNIDLSGASLQGASLFEASLQGASLDGASLQGASLIYASLQGASLDGASLQGASLIYASLQGASLIYASLQGASLDNASLQSASLVGASLHGASLDRANLQGASLKHTYLQGASLRAAILPGASLDRASLQGASLKFANLCGASLKEANLQGASLNFANLCGASLKEANLQGASLYHTILWRSYGRPVWQAEDSHIAPNGPVPALINSLQVNALTTDEVTHVLAEALSGVESTEAVETIKKALAPISMPEAEYKSGWYKAYWKPLTGILSVEYYQKQLANQLKELACDQAGAPYVAEGLITHRRQYMPLSTRQSIAKSLLYAASKETEDCPGLEGISEFALDKLRDDAAEKK